MPDERYVLEPRRENGRIVKCSRHNSGAAVDVTLVDANGFEVLMPSGFDEFTARAHRDYALASPKEKADRQILEDAMKAEGFEPPRSGGASTARGGASMRRWTSRCPRGRTS